ncbi:prepilin-type N-terminal cleavage/methylation domain-containing protein [Glaciecola siphonariae]|uniref:Prepilin-type N-terminal cleavage/methylation domain-containing protein n=1 Tax=Glaciecola siphonariae TaxID=521012 RepID=A0ABV9LX73_9ALTE
MNRDSELGFTLIELIIVIVILGILGAVAAPKFVDIAGDAHRARLEKLASDLKTTANLVHAKALTQKKAKGLQEVEVDNVTIETHSGYPSGWFDRSVRFLISLDDQFNTQRSNMCNNDWCGYGNATQLPDGTPVQGRAAIIFPNGYDATKKCYVTYNNAEDGEAPTVRIFSSEC